MTPKKYVLCLSSHEVSLIVVALAHIARHNADAEIVQGSSSLHDKILEDIGLKTPEK